MSEKFPLTKNQIDEKYSNNILVFDTIFKQAPIGIAINYCSRHKDPDKNYLIVNSFFEEITGYSEEEYRKLGWASISHPEDLQEDIDRFLKLQKGQIKSYDMEKRFIKPDGTLVWVYMVVASLDISHSGDEMGYICLIQDITKRKEVEKALKESERSKSVLLSHLPGMAYRCENDNDWTMNYVSDGCLELTGYRAESILYNKDLAFYDLIVPKYQDLLRREWDRILSEKKSFNYEYEIITDSGETKWVLELGQGVYDDYGNVIALEGIILDVSHKKLIEDQLIYNYEHDYVTDLFNRRTLVKFLERDKSSPKKRAVISINLNAMHMLTLIYGHNYSQALFQMVAESLKKYCDENHILFNTSEHRFVFYIKDYSNKEELMDFSTSISETLWSILMSERISVGIGVLEIEKNDHDVEQCLKDLLIASEKAINDYDGEYCIYFFDEDMEIEILREETIGRELSEIVAGKSEESLFLEYQPIYDIKSNLISGFEALSRYDSCEYGRISPLEFIPIAEKTKLIIPLGDIIIKKALKFLMFLNKQGYHKINMYINISILQILRRDFVGKLIKNIEYFQLDPNYIWLELTESVFSMKYDELKDVIDQLKEYGIKIAIDDFGTGYSSLERVRTIKANCLKVDKCFINNLMVLEAEEAITGDIISMAHKLGHCAIAEGVEDTKQLKYLKEHNCDKIQGYLISQPLNKDDLIKFIADNTELSSEGQLIYTKDL